MHTIKRKRSATLEGLRQWHLGARAQDLAARTPPVASTSQLTLDIPDSAYGTMDELSMTDDSDAACSSAGPGSAPSSSHASRPQHRHRRRATDAQQQHLNDSPRRSLSLNANRRFNYGINATASSSTSSLISDDDAHSHHLHPIYSLDAGYDADSSFDSVDSLGSTARSSPEPSEFEFDLTQMSPVRKSAKHHRHTSLDWDASSSLTRRHTFPRRRHRTRSASISISVVSGDSSSLANVVDGALKRPAALGLPALPPLTLAACALTATVSLWSLVSAYPVMHTSPVHLLRNRNHLALESVNSALSPFLVMPSKSAAALASANLVSLHSIEQESFTRLSPQIKAAALAGTWAAIVIARVVLSWLFGRVLGWAHSEWFYTSAIHEVGAGLAPLLLTFSIVRAYVSGRSIKAPTLLQLALLATNFCTPVEQGGSGPWMAVSAAFVGCVICAAVAAFSVLRQQWSKTASQSLSSRRPSPLWFARILACLALPLLAKIAAPAPLAHAPTTFASLHPRHPHLVTVLLMTAPRPGSPDFLYQTVESWLGALPEPDLYQSGSNSTTAERVRMIVYTHFRTHDVFDSAQEYFSTSPRWAAKSAHYLEWHRDARSADRLDQRLHVARGLDYAANHDGTSAYVMLTEDDFPLCPNEDPVPGREQSWTSSWNELERALVSTNEAMPDFDPMFMTSSRAPMSYIEQEATAGHCGLFVATGGSGLAMRGFIAAKLPTLLLGADDPHGDDRERRAMLGEFSIKHEDEGADTPDLVIQDCLRGRLPECRVCEAPDASTLANASRARKYPVGSARNGGSVLGDRWGKSGLAGTERLVQHHLGYNASTLPGRKYGKEEWACGWRQPFNGEPDVLIV
ncbi:hypothetical protein OIV83_000688 [Microbotryomycetes sp. JL201]|nr:hypothetical protein OIV83_000688 [Microbotryomycetes sp. JL201]